MKYLLFTLIFFLVGCKKDPMLDTLSRISFSRSSPMGAEDLSTFADEPAVRFQWKRALVKRLLEEEVEKKVTKSTKKESDTFMAQAESELTSPNGLLISGMVFYVPKGDQMDATKGEALMKSASLLAQNAYLELLLDPTEKGVQRTYRAVKEKLPEGLMVDLRVNSKLLGRHEVETPGWLTLFPLLDVHKNSEIDQVSPPTKIGRNIFLTILRERIKAETIPVSTIRKRANEITLAAKRKAEVDALVVRSLKGVSIEVFPETIQKEGSVK